jgi:hypothetical protein
MPTCCMTLVNKYNNKCSKKGQRTFNTIWVMTDLYMSWSSETFASIIVFCVSQMTANITVASQFNSSNCTDVISTFQIKCYWFTCRIRSKCNRFNTDEMCFVAGQNCILFFTNDFLFWNRLRKNWTQSSEILVLKESTKVPYR